MGSFNVGCGLSNLTIHQGDKVGFVILSEIASFLENSHLGKPWVLESGVKPFLPPVFGTYNDYGSIIDISESTTTCMLEALFLKPWAKVMRVLTEPVGAYEKQRSLHLLYAEPNNIFGNISFSREEQMASLGFEVSTHPKTGTPVFYYRGWQLENLHGAQWMLSKSAVGGNLLTIIYDNAKELATIFSQHTGIYPGFKDEYHPILAQLECFSGMFFLEEVFVGMSKNMEKDTGNDSFFGKFEDNWDDFIETFDINFVPSADKVGASSYFTVTMMDKYHNVKKDGVKRKFASSWGLKTNDFLTRKTSLDPQYYDFLHLYEDDYSFKQIDALEKILTATNRPYAPSISGEQFGNDEASQALNDVSNEILKVRKSQRDEDTGW